MIVVEIESIRISLISQHRIVMLGEISGRRQLPIWIGPCEAEAITLELQEIEVARPVTHDLLSNVVRDMGGTVSNIVISRLNDGVFFADLNIDVNGEKLTIDCRPSDAIAIAVRNNASILVQDEVMEEAGILPEDDESFDEPTTEDLDAFKDLFDTLDLDDPAAEG